MATSSQPPADRMDRRFRPEPGCSEQVEHREVVFRNGWGGIVQRFNVAELGLPSDMVTPVVTAMRTIDAGSVRSTRSKRWQGMRRFSQFLNEEGIRSAREIDAGVVRRFLASLERTPDGRRRSASTMARYVSFVQMVLEHIEQTSAVMFGSELAFPYNPFPRHREAAQPKARLSLDELRAILRACYEEIDAAWSTFQQGQAILSGTDPPELTENDRELHAIIRQLGRLGDGIMPSRPRIMADGISERAMRRHGSHYDLAKYYHLTARTMVPFYIALAIQLAANPEPLRVIRRDCLVRHPLDEDRVTIEWLKLKTGRKRFRVQRRSFDRRKPRSAPRLIEMLLEMTEPLIRHAPPDERECLFLVRHLRPGQRLHSYLAGVPSSYAMASAVRLFTTEANARAARWNSEHPDALRSELPNFTPGMLRGSVASAHYVESGGDLRLASSVLNHGSLATTNSYVEGEPARKLEHETIARLQRLMVSWVMDAGLSAPAPSSHRPVTALFGHRCLSPAIETEAGTRVCRHLAGCLACPGLVVPIDVDRLARILQARDHLIASREDIDPTRWNLFYAPSLRVLEEDLLPGFPVSMHDEAVRRIPSLPPLADLE
ncbi:phage integrase family protein [Hephaestia caeni]|uniref:Phage integrase family protein n=1 Tax=Hephaestia caeni TaxID=645617 RepID=A0A397PA46_9SPHN|nr:tyrosine-type recombinase/integrase [Hephaestia caeni]RIA46420.1 phage integrase family protein [Hephaestia caeni]